MAIRGKPKKRNLDQEEIASLLKKIGFKSERIIQEWRHLTAFGVYRDKEAVFKLASTQKTSRMTRNEYEWNDAVHAIHQTNHPSFTVPANYASGIYNKLFYFVSQRFKGRPFIDRDSKDISRIAPKIPRIARVCHEIISLKIPEDSEYYKRQSSPDYKVGEGVFNSASFWASQTGIDLDGFLKVIEVRKDNIRAFPAHGDFSPRQLYDVDSLVGIIDGELSGLMGPLYLDPVWFYLRMRIDHKNTYLASEFLREFVKTLKKEDRDIFWEEFKPVLIQKYIGELWGAGKKAKNIEDLKILGRDILLDKII